MALRVSHAVVSWMSAVVLLCTDGARAEDAVAPPPAPATAATVVPAADQAPSTQVTEGKAAQSPAATSAPVPADAGRSPATSSSSTDTGPDGESGAVVKLPSRTEQRVVAVVATGVALLGLAGGITFGVLARQQYACVQDVIACNRNAKNPIVGAALFDARADIEQKALAADIAYVFAASAAVVATVGVVRGFFLPDETVTETATDSHPSARLLLPGLLPRDIAAATQQVSLGGIR